MASTKVQVSAKPQSSSPGFAYSALIAGWLVPGAGHLMSGRWIRAVLLFLSIGAMFWLGIAMQGRLYAPNTGNILDILGAYGIFPEEEPDVADLPSTERRFPEIGEINEGETVYATSIAKIFGDDD